MSCVKFAVNNKFNFALRIMFCGATSVVSSTADEQRMNSQAITYPNIMQGHIQGLIFGMLSLASILLILEVNAQ
jgi:hypothetical protein